MKKRTFADRASRTMLVLVAVLASFLAGVHLTIRNQQIITPEPCEAFVKCWGQTWTYYCESDEWFDRFADDFTE